MNKNSLKRAALGIIALIILVLVSLVSFHTVLPTGVFIVPLAGIISVGTVLSLGSVTALIVTVIGAVIMIVLGSSGWIAFFTMIITTLIIGKLINWELPVKAKLPQSQFILVGIVAGIIQLLLVESAFIMVGWYFNHKFSTGWAFAQTLFPSEILTALLYAVLIPPVAMISRWLVRQILDENSNKHCNTTGSTKDK